jgi:Ala-tRNA(Pro) deacylase
MAAGETELYALLDQIGVSYARHAHEPVHTVAEAQTLRGALPGGHTKNLFLRAKDGAIWLVVCLEDRRIRIRDLERSIGARKLSFAKPTLLREILGVEPGSVTPLALINDDAGLVRVALDAQMMALETLNFHPLRNDATLAISNAGLEQFIVETGHESVRVDFDALEALAAG